MAKQNLERDYYEISRFAENYIGRRTIDCIEEYAKKRRIAIHRAGRAFFYKVEQGSIKLREDEDGIYYITEIAK